MIRALAPAALAVLVAGAACHRDPPPPAAPAAPEASGVAVSDGAPEPDVDACAIVSGRALIEGVVLESSDGSCRVYLSAEAAPGELAVRVSAAGDPAAAAIERDTGEGTLYANAGTVTLTEAADGRWVGSFAADDNAAPAVGSIAGTIDVTLTP